MNKNIFAVIIEKIKQRFCVVRLILTTKWDKAYLVSFNCDIIGEDMLPRYRKALSKHGFHLHNSAIACDGSHHEAWVKDGYTVGHRMSNEESLYADDDIYETVVSPIIKKER